MAGQVAKELAGWLAGTKNGRANCWLAGWSRGWLNGDLWRVDIYGQKEGGSRGSPTCTLQKNIRREIQSKQQQAQGIDCRFKVLGGGIASSSFGGGGWMRRRDCRFKAASGRAWEERLQI